ncbi:WD repeat protein [Aspergillus sclerotialis]|uniref:WD repeat protein n=1 Tax=Aspergillus sclerotialis TaxID=2070753 RepID=A0A3A2Z8Z3_9EURO|nr:WD repeat protein [Aspergillus sclerotialis]
MHNLKPTAASSLSLPPDSYIYSIDASSSGSFAAISSDDSLRVFDAGSLDLISLVSAKTHDGGVTSLRTYSAGDHPLLTTVGRDGLAKLWDLRTGNSSAVVNLQMQRKVPVLSVACCPDTNSIVAGTELASSQAVVAFWYALYVYLPVGFNSYTPLDRNKILRKGEQ